MDDKLKSDFWNIKYYGLIESKVVFDEPVNQETALDYFYTYKHQDVTESHEICIDEVVDMEAIGEIVID